MESSKFLLKLFAIIRSAVGFESNARFVATLHRFIQLFEHRSDRITKTRMPVERAALGSGGTIGVHEVHAILTDKADQRLSQFFNGLIERFRGGMPILAQ